MRARSPLLSRLARSLLLVSLGALGFATGGLGALGVTTPATAAFSVALDGTDQTPVYQVAMTVVSNGQQSGWHLLISATQFVNGTYTLSGNRFGGCERDAAGHVLGRLLLTADVERLDRLSRHPAEHGRCGGLQRREPDRSANEHHDGEHPGFNARKRLCRHLHEHRHRRDCVWAVGCL